MTSFLVILSFCSVFVWILKGHVEFCIVYKRYVEALEQRDKAKRELEKERRKCKL